MNASIHALMFDPQFYVFDLAIKSELTKFLIVEESNLSLAPFIDNRFEPIAQGNFSVSTTELFALESQHNIARPTSGYIFHHAFVCSTLLARCLNETDAFFSLKEPWILRRLADFKRARGDKTSGKTWREMFCNYNQLLAKNYRAGQRPVIKATNVANNLLVDVLRFMPNNPVIYLYSDLESFLVSNIKKPKDTQDKMPGLAAGFVGDNNFQRLFPKFCDIRRLSFLQVCALIWAANLHSFKVNTHEHSNHRAKTLLTDDFLADPAGQLTQLSAHFGHNPDPQEITDMTAETVTGSDAKHQENAYSKDIKAQEAQQIRDQNKIELQKAIDWIAPVVEELELMQTMRSLAL